MAVFALSLAFGAYEARTNPGAGGMAALGILIIAGIQALRDYHQTRREDELNKILSEYGLPTLEHSK